MTVQRLSISMSPEVEEIIRAAADASGETLSAWVTRAALLRAAEQAAIADGLAGVAEYEIENGPLPADLLNEADRVLDAAGIVAPDRDERRVS